MLPKTQQLGDFELVREIGRGGMGVVFEARQVSLNRKVALKVLGLGLGLTERAIDRFQHEAEAAARLHHSNIIPIYATGAHDGVHFYAMELVEGPSLDRVLRQLKRSNQPPTPLAETAAYDATAATAQDAGLSASSLNSGGAYFDSVARMLAGVADALDHAHRQGVIHRDVKPGNLLLSPDGRLSSNDFGLARMLEQPGMTMTGEFVGTPMYMAPEQIAAGRVPIDHRADVYSLGATLFETLTFRPPFQGERRDQVIAQVLYKEPPPPRRVNAKVPVDLETICLKAMEKDPDRRYQTAGQMAEDLRRYVNRFAINARRAGLLVRGKKWVKRNPTLTAAALVIVLALGTAGFFAWRTHDAETRYLAEEKKRQEEAAAEKRQAAIEKGMAAALAADLAAADKAVAEAELLGASAGETRLLRGFIDICTGRYAEAVIQLEQAVRLMSESVAARAMLAQSLAGVGDFVGYHRVLKEASTMSIRTPEDKLLLGYAVGILRPAEGLLLMDQALAQRSTGIGHVLRAGTHVTLVEFTGSLTEAEAAIVDCELAKRLLPGNPYALAVTTTAHLAAAVAYRKAGRLDKWKEHLAAAGREADELARFPENLKAVLARYYLGALRDGLEGRVNMAHDYRKVKSPSLAPQLAYFEAYDLYCRGRDAEAAELVNRYPRERLAGHICFLTALNQPGGKAAARKAFDLLVGSDANLSDRPAAAALLFAVGDPGDVAAIAREIRAAGEQARSHAYSPADHAGVLDFLEGKLSEADLLALSPANEVERTRRHYVIGWKRLGAGDRLGAQAEFLATYDIMNFGSLSWNMSRAVLIRMKAPNWPRAIVTK